MTTPRIVQVEISSIPRAKPRGLFDPMPKVTAKFADGTNKTLFEFYPDEINFCPSEFIGLTESEAHALRRKKDVHFLQT